MNEINLKVGDKLLCKKDDSSLNSFVYKGEYYIVNEVNYWILINNLDYFTDINETYYIWNFFYTPQELRKLKLKQLNETKSR